MISSRLDAEHFTLRIVLHFDNSLCGNSDLFCVWVILCNHIGRRVVIFLDSPLCVCVLCQYPSVCTLCSWCCPRSPTGARPWPEPDPRGLFFCTRGCSGRSCCPPPASSRQRSPRCPSPHSPGHQFLELWGLKDKSEICHMLYTFYKSSVQIRHLLKYFKYFVILYACNLFYNQPAYTISNYFMELGERSRLVQNWCAARCVFLFLFKYTAR